VNIAPRALRRAALAGLLICIAAPAMAGDPCAAPDDIAGTSSALPRVGAMLKPDSTLNVLTVGSATVFSPMESLQPGTVTGLSLGLGNGPRNGDLMPSDAAFPIQMAKDLEKAVPGLKVSVTVKGGRGMMASEMLDIIRSEFAAHHYQLVIWQTGTVEAVRNVPVGSFYQTLSDGSALVADAGADLVIVDPQFSRFLHANADLDPYTQTMQQISAQPGVILFHRFDLMRYWSGEGQIDLERTPKTARLKTVELLHSCLGASLSRLVLASAHLPP
jgi:acyl-CoA thioesterase-1